VDLSYPQKANVQLFASHAWGLLKRGSSWADFPESLKSVIAAF
jgi:hypothetical protein